MGPIVTGDHLPSTKNVVILWVQVQPTSVFNEESSPIVGQSATGDNLRSMKKAVLLYV